MKLLIVEDNTQLAETVKRGLEIENYVVDLAEDGEKGLFMAKTGGFDLIILDWMMPKKDGVEFLKEFRETDKKTPILMLTAKSESEDTVEGLDVGADDYLTKPFDFDVLEARIRSLLRRSTSGEIVLTCDNLELNPKTKTVKRAEQEIDLSAKEFRLLEYMMRHKNEVLSEDDIINNGWSYDYEGFSNIVTVYMRYLRNKVDRSFPDEKPLIQTIRGLGYKITDKE